MKNSVSPIKGSVVLQWGPELSCPLGTVPHHPISVPHFMMLAWGSADLNFLTLKVTSRESLQSDISKIHTPPEPPCHSLGGVPNPPLGTKITDLKLAFIDSIGSLANCAGICKDLKIILKTTKVAIMKPQSSL